MIILIRTNKISVFLLQDRERVSFNGIEWVMKCPNKNRAFGEWWKQIILSIEKDRSCIIRRDSPYTFKAVIEAYRLQSRLILFICNLLAIFFEHPFNVAFLVENSPFEQDIRHQPLAAILL